jgi:FeS assembly protein IscX
LCVEVPVAGGGTYGWTEFRRIAEELADAHAAVDPMSVRFVALREMVRGLPGFREEAGHPVNERILEEIQRLWVEERGEGRREEEE